MRSTSLVRDDSLSLAACLGSGYVAGGSQRWSPFDRQRKKRSRRVEYYCRIDASAVAGVFIVLLFFLMNALPSGHSHSSVDLAKSEHAALAPGARREDALRILVSRDGRSYLGNHAVSRDELARQIVSGVREGAENRVYILADARAKYADVRAVLACIQQTGVGNVTFITLPLQQ
jgi:biopolymer transport protein ExbD